MKMKILVSFLLVALLSVAAVADVVDQINTTWNNYNSNRPGFQWGQTFTPTLDYLTAVELGGLDGDHGWNNSTDGELLTIDVYESLGFGGGINLTKGAHLGSATRAVPLAPDTPDGVVWQGRFEFGFIDVSSYVGNPTDEALVFLCSISPNWAGEEHVVYDTGDPYANGVSVHTNNGGATWTWDLMGPSIDVMFRTYGSDVPEPATICLLGLGALALLRKRS
jgi:opacity protein-like surface antigen